MFKVEIINIIFKNDSLEVFFFQICDLKILAIFLFFTFFLEFT